MTIIKEICKEIERGLAGGVRGMNSGSGEDTKGIAEDHHVLYNV